MTNKKRIWLHLVLGSMFLVPFCLPGQVQAETITLADQAAYDAYVVAAGSNDVLPASSSSGNTITIGTDGATGPTITGYVVGGDSRNGDPTAANNNTITVTGSVVDGVIGGNAVIQGNDAATVDSTSITLQDSEVTGYIYNYAGSASQHSGDITAKVNGTAITVQNGTVGESIYNAVDGYEDGTGTVTNNTISIMSASVVNGFVYNRNITDAGIALINSNTINIENSKVEKNIYNYARTYDNGDATDSSNTVNITDSTVGGQIYNFAYADGNGTATTSDNTTNVTKGSTVTGAISNTAQVGGTGTAIANNNTITLADATVTGNVTVAWAFGTDISKLQANNNTLNIKGTVDLSQSVLAGGILYDTTNNTENRGTNNTINMYSKGVMAKSVAYFNNYNFYLPAGTKAGDTMLTLTVGKTNLTDTIVDIKSIADDFTLKENDKVNLISNANGVTVDPNQPTTATVTKGVALDYDLGIGYDANSIYATVKGARANERTKSFLEGRLGASMFVNKGADIIGDNNIMSNLAPERNYEGIAILDYGKEKATTGSSVEVKGLSMLLGFGKAVDSGKGTLRWAPFIEAGWGSYNTENEFLNYADVNGKGDTDYYGVGFMTRKTGESGNYIEGSVRAGRVGDDYNSDLSYNGKSADYDITTTYYGAHVGIGKLMEHDKYDLDVFAKYFYNKVKGDDVTIFATDYNFDDTTSNRLKAGFKYTGKLSKNNTWFGGAAWEYEMSGSQRGTVSGYDIAAPDYKGSTGVVTAGYSYTPDDKKYDADFSLSERFGKRHGLSARVNCRFKI